jgi:hypothetical protein
VRASDCDRLYPSQQQPSFATTVFPRSNSIQFLKFPMNTLHATAACFQGENQNRERELLLCNFVTQFQYVNKAITAPVPPLRGADDSGSGAGFKCIIRPALSRRRCSGIAHSQPGTSGKQGLCSAIKGFTTFERMRIRSIAAFSRLIAHHSEHQPAMTGIPPLKPAAGCASVSLVDADGYSVVELHNPQARNALTPQM